MTHRSVCCPPLSAAAAFAARILRELGIPGTDRPDPGVGHLLLPVPLMPAQLQTVEEILRILPEDTIISGGKLTFPCFAKFRCIDFLSDQRYLAENADLTARCAICLAQMQLEAGWQDIPVLILGWGRIGKCLSRRLTEAGATVTVSARKEADLAMIHALGMSSLPISHLTPDLRRYRVILNTVPAMLLPRMDCSPDCTALELASVPGMAGSNVQSARELPGRFAPGLSGKLIAEAFVRLSLQKEDIL